MSTFTLIPHELSFTDRGSYLAWRTEWRRQYAELTTEIRHNKRELKRDQRENGGANQHRYQINRENQRSTACSMLHVHEIAKKRAGELAQAAHDKRLAQKAAA